MTCRVCGCADMQYAKRRGDTHRGSGCRSDLCGSTRTPITMNDSCCLVGCFVVMSWYTGRGRGFLN